MLRIRPLFNPFLWKMAWRDSRSERRKLFLFASAIIMGVAALVAVNSFGENLGEEVDNQAKALLGADVVFSSRTPFAKAMAHAADSAQAVVAEEVGFTSMVLFPGTGGTRLSQIRALEGPYPFYGEFETEPAGALAEIAVPGSALIDQAMMIQYGVSIGDSVRVGNASFVIRAAILGIPGETAAASLVGPRVYIPLADLKATGLIRTGSIATWKQFWMLPEGTDVDALVEKLRPITRPNRISADTVEERREGVNEVVDNVTRFLNVIGFLALLLGAVGIASSIHIYTKRKLATVAVLRCLGLQGWEALFIFFVQTVFFGMAGTLVGAAIGIAMQLVLPFVVEDFLPVKVQFGVSWAAVAEGLITGFVVSVVFSLLPLLGIRRVSPLAVLRSDLSENPQPRDPLRWALLGAAVVLAVLFAWRQTGHFFQGVGLAAAVAVVAVLLAGLSAALVWGAKRAPSAAMAYVWRQGLANLHRPNNQSLILVLALGMGTMLIITQMLVQHSLLRQVDSLDSRGQPNLVLFDVQADQSEGVRRLVEQQGLPVLDEVPIVTMRITRLKGRTTESLLRDSTRTVPRWAIAREFRSTYRNRLSDTERLVEGEFTPTWQPSDGAIPISLETGIAADLAVSVGDSITVDVQGVSMQTVVGSVREVDWRRVQPNFFMLFPQGPLDKAPQFRVIVSRTDDRGASARLQRSVVENYPNVSALDLDLVLATIQNVLDNVSFVIRFMAVFSIATGLIVLAGSVIISRYQRIKENVLLRTLGASRRQIVGILLAEYTFLASFAVLAGLAFAAFASWLLMKYVFESPLYLPWPTLLAGWAAMVALTLAVAWWNSRSTFNRPPLEVLRNEL